MRSHLAHRTSVRRMKNAPSVCSLTASPLSGA
jgi:hypothetical protein